MNTGVADQKGLAPPHHELRRGKKSILAGQFTACLKVLRGWGEVGTWSRTWSEEILSKNVVFSLWGNRATTQTQFGLLHDFWNFRIKNQCVLKFFLPSRSLAWRVHSPKLEILILAFKANNTLSCVLTHCGPPQLKICSAAMLNKHTVLTIKSP